MTTRFMPIVHEGPVPGESTREARERRERNQLARQKRDRFHSERCGRCGYARINVRHETDPATAPEGPDYYRDMEFCDFLPTGDSQP